MDLVVDRRDNGNRGAFWDRLKNVDGKIGVL